MFISCTSNDVKIDDPYPKYICTNCLKRLHEAYKFWQQCKDSIDKFNIKLNIKIEVIEIESKVNCLESDNENQLYAHIETEIKNDLVFDKKEHFEHSECSLDSNTKDITDINLLSQNTNDSSFDVSEELSQSSRNPRVNLGLKKGNDVECEQQVAGKFVDVSKIRRGCTENNKTNNVRRCLKCQIIFNSIKQYRSHYEKEHKKRISYKECNPTYLCTECGYTCFGSSNFKNHLATHSSERSFKCDICEKAYKTNTALWYHKNQHKSEMRYECEYCNKKFVKWSAKYSHIKTYHKSYDYVCEICSKAFCSADKLSIHVRRHTGEKPFKCKECNMAFVNGAALKRHELKHTGIKNYSCRICEKKFIRPDHLKQHLITHNKQAKCECDICKKTFKHPHLLKRHKKIHDKAKSDAESLSEDS